MAKTSWEEKYNKILSDIEKREFSPVYLLMGEEPYYIDKIADRIDNTVLTEDEKSFNQTTIYCTKDKEMENLSYFMNVLRKYPMMSEYQVVFLKEAQNLKILNDFLDYVQNPLRSTILVICYKHGKVDKRTKLVAAIEKTGVVFESPKVNDYGLLPFIERYCAEQGKSIDYNLRQILADSIGSDLSRLTSELDKLMITMPKEEKAITAELIERNIGISKDFNCWELQRAIVNKNVFKANQIIAYFNSNPKATSPIMVVAILFRYFATLMQVYYAPGTSTRDLEDFLGVKGEYAVRDYVTGRNNYTGRKVMAIIDKLRETDAKLKGVGVTGDVPQGDLMQELIYFILH